MTDKKITIYIRLMDEGTDVCRPIFANKIDDKHYEILDIDYHPKAERWEFIPKDIVECMEQMSHEDGQIYLLAISKK